MQITISAVASVLPSRIVTSKELEDQLRQQNPHLKHVPNGIIEATTGIVSRHISAEDEYPSTLASQAAIKLFSENNIEASSVDLLLFAAAGQDLIEPSTAAIIQEMLGLSCPAFDVKNACNSVLNAIEVAKAMMLEGRYKRVLIVTGETPSKSIKYLLKDKNDFKQSFAGYTFGDAGAALLLEPTDSDSGIQWQQFITDGTYWNTGTLPGGGARHPRGDEFTYFHGNAAGMVDGFLTLGSGIINEALRATNTKIGDYKHVLVHQPSVPILQLFLKETTIPQDAVVLVAPTLGNMAAASLPVALSQVWGDLSSGERCLFIGLAGGISLGVMVFVR